MYSSYLWYFVFVYFLLSALNCDLLLPSKVGSDTTAGVTFHSQFMIQLQRRSLQWHFFANLKLHHKDFYRVTQKMSVSVSKPEVRFYVFTCVSDSEFCACVIWTLKLFILLGHPVFLAFSNQILFYEVNLGNVGNVGLILSVCIYIPSSCTCPLCNILVDVKNLLLS